MNNKEVSKRARAVSQYDELSFHEMDKVICSFERIIRIAS